MKVKVIVSATSNKTYNPNDYVILQEGESKFDYIDQCFLENSVFANKSRFVCISYKVDKKTSRKRIYRMAVSGNRDTDYGSIKKNQIGLLRRDIHELKIKDLNNADIQVTACWLYRIPFYLLNPNYAVRISFILGGFSVLLGVLSLVLGLCLKGRCC